MANSPICSIGSCCKPAKRRGWCYAHYERWRRHGDPLNGSTWHGEPMQFFSSGVLDHHGDDCLTWPYSRDTAGYAQMRVEGRNELVHRLACEASHGPPPTPLHEVAHSCGNGHLGCVNPHHLRWATHAENMAEMVAHGKARGSRVCAHNREAI